MSNAETPIQNRIMIALSLELGALVTRVNCGRFRQLKGEGIVQGAPTGTADLLVCVGGRYFAVEVKTPEGKQTKEQRDFQRAVEARGGVYLLVRSPQDAVAQVRAALEAA